MAHPALITGCSSGIGRAVAQRLAREGWRVYATARTPDRIADLADSGCEIRQLDVTDRDAVESLVAEIEQRHGAVGALVNNAGYGQQGPVEETPVDAFRAQFETNVFAVVGLCQAVLPGMRRAGGGRIVNVSSMGGRLTFPGGGAYHASKYALEALSDVLRFEVAGFGVRVVVIEPGPTASAFGETSLRTMDALRPTPDRAYDGFRAGVRAALESTFGSEPMEGSSTPDDVADAVWASLSDDEPEPRVVVGAMAEQLIAVKEASSAQAWDATVATMYPRPGG